MKRRKYCCRYILATTLDGKHSRLDTLNNVLEFKCMLMIGLWGCGVSRILQRVRPLGAKGAGG